MRIAPDIRKSQLLDGLQQARNGILAELSALPPQKRNEAFLGTWSAYDLVAHLIGWDFTNIQAAKDILADQLPQFLSLIHILMTQLSLSAIILNRALFVVRAASESKHSLRHK